MSELASGFEFTISGNQSNDAYVIEIAGDVDLVNAPALAAHLDPVPKRVTIDLGGCTYFGSSAAAALVAAATKGATITLRRVPANVQRVLDITGIAPMFSFED